MEPKQVVYLAGPITGNDGYREFFAYWENIFTQGGYAVMNPTKLEDPDEEKSWIQYVIQCLGYLMLCDYVALLPGWEESMGARIEMMVAIRLNKPLIIPPGSATDVTFKFEATNKNEVIDLKPEDIQGFAEDVDLSDIPGWNTEVDDDETTEEE